MSFPLAYFENTVSQYLCASLGSVPAVTPGWAEGPATEPEPDSLCGHCTSAYQEHWLPVNVVCSVGNRMCVWRVTLASLNAESHVVGTTAACCGSGTGLFCESEEFLYGFFLFYPDATRRFWLLFGGCVSLLSLVSYLRNALLNVHRQKFSVTLCLHLESGICSTNIFWKTECKW